MGVVGAALRGFGRALKNRKIAETIKSVKPAKNLTSRKKEQQKLFKSVDDKYTERGVKPGPQTKASEIKVSAAKKSSKIHDKYEKAVKARKDYNKNLKRKTIGAGAAAIGGITGAHGVAKHKFPKYKKFMEQDIAIKDGKVKLVPKKKK
jgi:hypothetical protein